METTKSRAQYLASEWTPYPRNQHPALTLAELKETFGRAVTGQTLKAAEFHLGGRLHAVLKTPMADGIEQFTLMVEGDELVCRTDVLNASPDQVRILRDVLVPGDWILIRCAWTHVHTSGLFPKIETLSPSSLTLVAPNLEFGFPTLVSHKRLKQWNLFLTTVRKCFEFLQFTEVRTPTLVSSPGLEPFLDPFETDFVMGRTQIKKFLPTSPEFHMKRLLCGGTARIYEFKECFRNGEIGPNHQPEFLMMEWYRTFADLDAIIKDIKGLLNYLKLHWPQKIRGSGPLEIKTMAAVFQELLEFELTPQTSRQELCDLCAEIGVQFVDSDSWDEVFHRIFLEKIEPHLGLQGPVVVRDFPPSQCAWARITEQGWADRGELYWRGVELANGYNELNDPVEQERRFVEAIEKRQALGRSPLPLDQEFLKALRTGMPPAAGIALGLDRLFMLITDADDLSQTRTFPMSLD